MAAAQHEIDDSRGQLGSLAVLAYMGSGDSVLSAVLKGDSTAAARQRELLSSSLDHRKQDLEDAQQQLAERQGPPWTRPTRPPPTPPRR